MGRRLDIKAGSIFGILKVLELTDITNKYGIRLHKVICTLCFKEDMATSSQLVSGKRKSCECQKGKPRTINIGDKYNLLTITGFSGRDTCGNLMAVCDCECGTKNHKIRAGSVKLGTTRSCGCLKGTHYQHKVGEKFNKLTIISTTGLVSSNGQRIVICQCECGNERRVLAGELVSGHVKACKPCMKNSRISKDPWPLEFDNYKQRAIVKRELEWKLTREQFELLAKLNCFYCDKPPAIKASVAGLIRNGIDRLDSSIGYILENCVPCCAFCNRVKRDVHIDILKSWIETVYNRLIKGK